MERGHVQRDQIKAEMDVLKAELAAVKTAVPRTEEKKDPEKLPYVDVATLTKEQRDEWRDEDRDSWDANLMMQARYEAKQEILNELKAEKSSNSVKETYDNYVKDNPDFTTMWKKGEIKAFMDKNPGHTAISAHMAMTLDRKIKDAAEKSAKETEAKVLANLKAKRSASVLGGGPGVPTGAKEDDELKDTKKHGGFVALAARKIALARKAGGR
jgi:hypothetical protein